jgi:hypothetical protein
MPPTGSSGLPWRWYLHPQVHAARVRHPRCRNRSLTTAQRAGGGNPGQDDPDAAGVLDLDPRAALALEGGSELDGGLEVAAGFAGGFHPAGGLDGRVRSPLPSMGACASRRSFAMPVVFPGDDAVGDAGAGQCHFHGAVAEEGGDGLQPHAAAVGLGGQCVAELVRKSSPGRPDGTASRWRSVWPEVFPDEVRHLT